jgi:FAD/FMN-containing dehydrogenase
MTGVQPATDQMSRIEDAMHSLQESFRGPLLRPGDAEYDEARTVWNAMIDRKPAIIAQCTGTDDVIAVVNAAREHGLLLSIHGGGHNVAGNAVCDGGLMLDCSLMKGIAVDAEARTARAEAGVLWGEFDAATQEHGLATTGGTVSTTGIAGLTLGGGFGFLQRRFGLVCDNVVSVEIVTADGQLRTASANEHPDLFWAVRGGGGNFGVVTSIEYRLYPVGPTVLGGLILHPLSAARDVLRYFREFAQTAPDEFGSFVGFLTSPEGEPLLALVICYSGSLEEGETVLRPLRAFGAPAADLVGQTPYTAVQSLFDPAFPPGRRNYWKSSFMHELSDAAIETMVSHFEAVPSPLSAAGLEHFGGAVSRVGEGETAFGQRDMTYSLLIASEWTDPAENDANIKWARDFWQAMQPYTRSAAYVNYLDAEEQDRVSAAYGNNYERLVALKTAYDPANLFRMNQNIKPA